MIRHRVGSGFLAQTTSRPWESHFRAPPHRRGRYVSSESPPSPALLVHLLGVPECGEPAGVASSARVGR